MQPLYTAVVTASQGREGRVRSEDGTLDLALAMPKALGGPGGAKTNPEQLFAAGYAACFGGALAMVARQQKIKLPVCDIEARVHIGKAGEGFGLSAELTGHFGDLAKEQGQKLMELAHQHCPYSKATRGNLEVTLHVK